MAELFGTPLGTIAKQESDWKAASSELGAMKTIGEIEMQPVEKAYKGSLAALHLSEARLKGAEATGVETLSRLSQQLVESDARDQLVGAAAAQGQVATSDDLKGGTAVAATKPKSRAYALERLADLGERSGVSPVYLGKINEQIVKIKREEATAGYRHAQEVKQTDDVRVQKMEEVGAAAYVAAGSPRGYVQMLMQGKLPPEVMQNLTGNYAADRPALQALADSSIKAIDQAKLKQTELVNAARIKRLEAARSASGATASAASARADLTKARLAHLNKWGGPTAEATIEAKKASADAARAKTTTNLAHRFPPMPLDPKDIVPDATTGKWGSYTHNGVIYDVLGKDGKGEVILRKRVATVVPKGVAVTAGGDDDDEEDDNE